MFTSQLCSLLAAAALVRSKQVFMSKPGAEDSAASQLELQEVTTGVWSADLSDADVASGPVVFTSDGGEVIFQTELEVDGKGQQVVVDEEEEVATVFEEQVLRLRLFPLSQFPTARCNDGTPGGYYFEPSPNGSDLWIVHFQGGAYCYNKPTCDARRGSLISSDFFSSTRRNTGILASPDRRLRNANKVYLPYCTSDLYRGSVGIEETGNVNKHFRGFDIVNALWDTLVQVHGLNGDSTVIWSGCSAGSVGVFLNIDDIVKRLGSNVKRVVGVGDSGLALNVEPLLESVPPLSEQTAEGYALIKGERTLNQDCIRDNADSPGLCIIPDLALQYVNHEEYVIFQYLYDSFYVNLNVGSAVNTPAERRYAERYRGFTNAATDLLLDDSKSGPVAVLQPACYLHCTTERPGFWESRTDGVSLQDIVLDVVFNNAKDIEVVDSCRGFDCGECSFPEESEEDAAQRAEEDALIEATKKR